MSKKLSTEEFIKRARQVHGNTYDYSEALYKTAKIKVKIKCTKHGIFEQLPHGHLTGRKCIKCSVEQSSLTTEEFIEKAKKIHGTRYNYSLVDYTLSKNEIIIICKEHGQFKQKPNSHLNGSGCKECSDTSLSSKEFISRARKVHGNFYDYSDVVYKGIFSKVVINCKIHGLFKQRPDAHLGGQGCNLCGHESTKKKRSSNSEEFIKKALNIHGTKYDYSKVNYKNNSTLITIICPDHGSFEQQPNNHLFGKGCNDCGIKKSVDSKTYTQEEYLKKAVNIHGDKYDYSKVIYINSDTKIIINCSRHGDFTQDPSDHLQGGGCGKCINKSEGKIAEYLEKKFIIHRSHRIGEELKFFDFFLPDYNLLIERDGEQHYQDIKKFSLGKKNYMKKQIDNDRYKTELAKKHGYKIARIPYWLNDEQVKREIDNILAGNPSYPDVPDLKQAETKPLPK